MENLLKNIEGDILGETFEIFGRNDLDNAMMELGFDSLWDDASPQDMVDDHEWIYTFYDEENDSTYNVGISWCFATEADEELASALAQRAHNGETIGSDEWEQVGITVWNVEEV